MNDSTTCNPDLENWKEIAGYEGLYAISDLGRVKRLFSRTSGKAGNLLKPQTNGKGYHHVILYKNRTKWCVRIHILVMLMFVGECPEGLEINHIKGIKTDNRLSQLEYVTHPQNVQHRFDVLGHKGIGVKGEKHLSAKLKTSDVLLIRSQYEHQPHFFRDVSRYYGVDAKTIRNIINRVKWTHI